MKVTEALQEWRARTGQRETAYREPRLVVRVGRLALAIPNPGQLHWHDLHHLVLGYGTDLVGEIEISAFELRTLPRTFIVFLLCLAGVAAGVVIAPRRTLHAWRRARGCRNLYRSGLTYGSVLTWSMEDLVAWMIPPDPDVTSTPTSTPTPTPTSTPSEKLKARFPSRGKRAFVPWRRGS